MSRLKNFQRNQPVQSKLFIGLLLMGLFPLVSLLVVVFWSRHGSVEAVIWWAVVLLCAGVGAVAWWVARQLGEPIDRMERSVRGLLANVGRLIQTTSQASNLLRRQLATVAQRPVLPVNRWN